MPMIAFNPKDLNQKNEKTSSTETSSEDKSHLLKEKEIGFAIVAKT